MKNKAFKFSIIAVVLVMVFTGCLKKGDDDPFVSFRSRDGRITGEWVIRSFTKTVNIQEETNSQNNINDEKTNIVNSTLTDTTISGNTMTVESTFTSTNTQRETHFELGDTSYLFITENNITNTESHSLKKFTFAVDLEIKDDGTWHASYSQTHLSTESRILTMKNGVDTLFYEKIDTVFIPQSSYQWTAEGEWTWSDSDKPKVIIHAGPMQGNIVRLANDEVIIDDGTTHTENSTENVVENLLTYDDVQDPYKTEDGIETTTYARTTTSTISQEWEPK